MGRRCNKAGEKQKSLKDKYRSILSSVTGSLDQDLSCSFSTASQSTKVAGLHPPAGGPDFEGSGELRSSDM